MNASRTWVWVCVVVGLLAGTVSAVNIDLVTVGNAGNAGDSRYGGYGGVSYGYNIGKYEVTAGQYTEFLNRVAGVDAYGLYNASMSDTSFGSGIARSGGGTVGNLYTYSVASSFATRPVNYVSYWDACRFSNWLNNGQPTGPQNASTTEDGAYALNGYTGDDGRTIQRNASARWVVPSEDEWYKAAYHKNDGVTGNYFDYPTSSDTAPGRDMADASGNNANHYGGSGPWPIDSPYYTTVAGEFQLSDSPYGTFDQGGNVFEWNEEVVEEGDTWSSRGLRGGSFDGYGGLIASYRHNYFPTVEDDGVGFRVVEVPEPATAGLFLLGGLFVARCRRAHR
jgi:formylglycine-generating enzyme required for sulfatase activity